MIFYIKKIFSFARRLYRERMYLKEYLGPYFRTMDYKGFRLHYTRGTSLIGRILRGETYEPEITYGIIKELKLRSGKVFIDVGANIGLITLNVMAALPDTKIHAFEPGSMQFGLLKRTVDRNNIADKVYIYEMALSSHKGRMKFYAHRDKHSSGDGFIDTEMAGRTKINYVNTDTLDGWWRSCKREKVDVIKIDTEGSELWVLQGAEEMIKSCRPVIFIEISKSNIMVYPHEPVDVIKHLEKMGYVVSTLAGTRVDNASMDNVLAYTEMFVARTS